MDPVSPYAGYDVLDKWDGPSFNDATRRVLAERLKPPGPCRFLTPSEAATLRAAADQITPQPDRADPIPIVERIDARLAADQGPGYRRVDLPPLREAWRAGLAGLDAEARRTCGRSFAYLAGPERDAVLRRVQAGEVDPADWGLPAQDFFRDVLLKTIVAVYYAHPLAWNEIGFGGPAAPRGYVRLGFNERDPWEARERS